MQINVHNMSALTIEDSESFDSENGSVADGEENDSYPDGDILSCISEYDTDGSCSSPAAQVFLHYLFTAHQIAVQTQMIHKLQVKRI